jgi:hypothetical protein
MKIKKDSIVVGFVRTIYDHSNSGKGHSWTILNGALYNAVSNAINAHLPFELDDFKQLYGFKGGYWFGTDGDGKNQGERFYTLAVDAGNMSACASFEAWRQFKPYLFLGRRLCVSGYQAGGGDLNWPKHSPEEVVLNCLPKNETGVLDWLSRCGFRWFVTGMDAEKIRLASYYRKGERGKHGHHEGKPTKLLSLRHDDLDSMSRDLRKALKAATAKPKQEAEVGT